MSYVDQFKGLSKQVYVLCFARLISGIGSMVFSFSSVILTRMVGLSLKQAGTVIFLYSIASVLGAVAGGRLADFYGRKRIFCIFTAITCTLFLISAYFCTSIWIVPLTLGFVFFGSGCYPAVSAMVADCVPEGKSAEAFSLLYLSHNLGFAVGPAIGGMLMADHLPLVYQLQALVFFIGALVLQFFTEEKYVRPSRRDRQALREGKEKTQLYKGTLAMLMRTKIVVAFIVILTFLTMSHVAAGFVLPLQFIESFGLAKGGSYSGAIWSVNALVVVLGTPLAVRYTKKHHQFRCMSVGGLLYAAGFGAYAYVSRLPLYFLAVVVWSFGEIFISTGAGAFIAENSPASHVARFQAIYDMARSAGRGIGPLVFGFLVSVLPYPGVWELNALACVAGAAVCYFIYKKA